MATKPAQIKSRQQSRRPNPCAWTGILPAVTTKFNDDGAS